MKTLKDISKLPYKYQISELPNIPAIYFIIKGKQVLYIGQSEYLRTRMFSHKGLIDKYTPKIYYLLVADSTERKSLEAHYIDFFNPVYNIVDNRENILHFLEMRDLIPSGFKGIVIFRNYKPTFLPYPDIKLWALLAKKYEFVYFFK